MGVNLLSLFLLFNLFGFTLFAWPIKQEVWNIIIDFLAAINNDLLIDSPRRCYINGKVLK